MLRVLALLPPHLIESANAGCLDNKISQKSRQQLTSPFGIARRRPFSLKASLFGENTRQWLYQRLGPFLFSAFSSLISLRSQTHFVCKSVPGSPGWPSLEE